jgi:hypothetical protein
MAKTIFTEYAGKDSIPMPEFQVEEVSCPHCRQFVRFPVYHSFLDADKAISETHAVMEKMHDSFNGLIAELIQMFPGVPIEDFMIGRKKQILRQLHESLNKFNEDARD